MLDTPEFITLASGGLAETVIQLCGLQGRFEAVDPALTLKGLALLYEYNRQTVSVSDNQL